MSDFIKHECGIALVRLRKPLQYYIDKYNTPKYGFNKLFLLMQKQINRGQDGAGVACVKMGMEPGRKYMNRERSVDKSPLEDVFNKIGKKFKKRLKKAEGNYYNAEWLKNNIEFTGEVFLGHLRYVTHGENTIESCHPRQRASNWRSRNLLMAGNFNMTNVDELFHKLLELGQSPREKTDTVTVMEKIGHFLDEENQRIFDYYKGDYTNRELSNLIENQLDLARVLSRSCKDFDGGYAMAGLTGYGAAFVARDPAGIRPAYYYADDEIVVAASEKPAIKTALEVNYEDIKEVKPGHALIVDKAGNYSEQQFSEPKTEKTSCSFERIYFSRGSDPDIYRERKRLGELLVPQVLDAIDGDLKNTVFSYIPNTAETSFLGMIEGLEEHLINKRREALKNNVDPEAFDELLAFRPRVEKLVIKDAKLRTFITDDDQRDELVSRVYDTTYEVIRKGIDTIVVIDDSIVRGTTLEQSILTLLNRLEPKRVIIVSSAPQIRYPDCYGINMSRMREFIAFRAVLELLRERNMEGMLDEVYEKTKANLDDHEVRNFVQELYGQFTDDEVTSKIAQIVTPKGMTAEVKLVFQTVENLHKACPNHKGDWYFTGNYPTTGGTRVVNKSFALFREGSPVRAY